MSVVTLTSDGFDDAVGLHPVLVVEFPAPTATSSPLEALAEAQSEVAFGRVTQEASARISAMFGLPAGPGLVIFRERIVLYCEPGAHSGDRVEGLLAQVCSLDMDAVRAAIEEEKQAAVALRMRRVCPTARRGRLPEP
jgi:thioredoxin 1